jgi:hypothetical protein
VNTQRVVGRLDALIKARNDAHTAQQAFADAHVTRDADTVSEALYQATYELVHQIDNNVRAVNNSSDGFHCTWCGLDANAYPKGGAI